MTAGNLPLFTWHPSTGEVIAFPLARQGNKVSETARKLLAKTTEKHADYYRGQVTQALANKLLRLGVANSPIDEQIGAFWNAVEFEMARLALRGQRPGGMV